MKYLSRTGASLLAVVVFGLWSVSMAWGNSSDFDCPSLLETTAKATDADDLCWLLRTFLESHHSCEFPREYLDRVTRGGAIEGNFERSREDKCLKKVVIENLRIDEIGVLGDITLKNKRKEFVSILVYSDEKWLMYWPTRSVRHVH